jgi:hypothetical protein
MVETTPRALNCVLKTGGGCVLKTSEAMTHVFCWPPNWFLKRPTRYAFSAT